MPSRAGSSSSVPSFATRLRSSLGRGDLRGGRVRRPARTPAARAYWRWVCSPQPQGAEWYLIGAESGPKPSVGTAPSGDADATVDAPDDLRSQPRFQDL